MASLLPKLPLVVGGGWNARAVLACLLLLICAGAASGQKGPTPAAAGQGRGEATSGQTLVAQSAQRLQAESSIRAQIRCRFGGFGQDLVGSGTYLQLGDGPEKLLRLDLKVQLGDSAAVVQQISGEQFYWNRRDLPGAGVRLGRVDLRIIRQAISKAEAAAAALPGANLPPAGGAGQGGSAPTGVAVENLPAVESHEAWLLLGGLPALLANLDRSFVFASAQRDDLEFPSAAGGGRDRLPVWIVAGRLRPERLAQLAGDRGRAAVQLPTRVQLILGATEKVFPLFPYRVSYHHHPEDLPGAPSDDKKAAVRGPTLLAQLECFGVQHAPALDPRDFEYNPGQQEVQEQTQVYLQKLGLAVGK